MYYSILCTNIFAIKYRYVSNADADALSSMYILNIMRRTSNIHQRNP